MQSRAITDTQEAGGENLDTSTAAWNLVILAERGEMGCRLALPGAVPGWKIETRELTAADPAALKPDILLLALSPDTTDLGAWLTRLRLFHPRCQVLLAEAEQGVEWYRAAIGLGVDGLLAPPASEEGWSAYLGEAAEALSADLEQSRFLGRLEHSNESLEQSRRHLAEMLLKSYENLGRVHRQLTQRLGQLSILYQLGRDLSQEANWDRALKHFLSTCVDTLEFDGVALMLWSFDTQRLALRAKHGLSGDSLEGALRSLRELPAERRGGTEILALVSGQLLAGDQLQSPGASWELSILPLVHGGEAQGYLLYRKTYANYAPFGGDFHFLKTVQTILGEELANAKAVHRLKRLGEFNRTVLESVPAAVLTVDGRGRVSYRNPQAAQLFEERLREERPFAFDEGFHLIDGDESRPEERDWLQRECVLRRGDGADERRLLLSTARLPVRHETDVRHVMICEDLTEHQRLESELRRAERLSSLGQLSAGMAHEIRNPLAGIAMTAQVLRGKLAERDDAAPYLDRIQDETQRLERIVRSLLDFSRPAPPRLEALDLREIAQRALADLVGPAEAAGVEVEELTGEPLPVWADRDQIQQVLLNLLLNAVQACAPGDRVGLRLARSAAVGGGEGRVRVTVQDSGPGVPEAARAQLFDPFYTTKAEGTGLGLSICQKIMAEHGSQIRYRPCAGGGSEFILDLAPASPTDPREENRP